MKKLIAPPYTSPTGSFYTKPLFRESWLNMPVDNRAIEPVFSLYEDKPGLINARTTFVALGDPTGYEWATKYLGSWRHWMVLEKLNWFKAALDVWREELRIKQTSEAIRRISVIAAATDDKQSLMANKYLAEEGWLKGAGRGRPSKAEIDKNAKAMAEADKQTLDDIERIGGLKVVTGGKS